MSEYQFVHFIAVDKPLSDEQLAYMEKQSTRAEISRWEFSNEYHYGDFRGNAREMLRRGYDLHLHFADFGIRKLMIRLPAGLPCDKKTWQAFELDSSLEWEPDKKGRGGILSIEPEADAGTFDYLDSADELLPAMAPLRAELMGGDLRALYLAWLACNWEEEALEPPVPAGLRNLSKAHQALAEFYELSEDLIAAAAVESPALKVAKDTEQKRTDAWVAGQSLKELQKIAKQILAGEADVQRAEILASIRAEAGVAICDLAKPTRTLAQLRAAQAGMHDKRLEQEQKAREAARRKRMKQFLANPKKVVAQVHKLVEERSGRSYQEAARQLADLREALGPEAGPKLVNPVAKKLRVDNPRLKLLIGALRKQHLLD